MNRINSRNELRNFVRTGIISLDPPTVQERLLKLEGGGTVEPGDDKYLELRMLPMAKELPDSTPIEFTMVAGTNDLRNQVGYSLGDYGSITPIDERVEYIFYTEMDGVEVYLNGEDTLGIVSVDVDGVNYKINLATHKFDAVFVDGETYNIRLNPMDLNKPDFWNTVLSTTFTSVDLDRSGDEWIIKLYGDSDITLDYVYISESLISINAYWRFNNISIRLYN